MKSKNCILNCCIFVFCLPVVYSQTVAETIDYINSRVISDTKTKEEIWVTDIGELKKCTIFYYDNGRIYRMYIETLSPFEVSATQSRTDPYQVSIICNSGSRCISSIEKTSFVEGPNTTGTTFHLTVLNIEQVNSVINAINHLIDSQKDVYSRYHKAKSSVDPFAASYSDGSIVQMIKTDANLYEIPVELNGVLKIKFLLDTGASDVFLSPDVFLTLQRTGTLTSSDFAGTSIYSFANGTREECKKYIIQSMKIGDRVIPNVICAVANSIDVDMLLGQAFLQKLGHYRIDNTLHQLILE